MYRWLLPSSAPMAVIFCKSYCVMHHSTVHHNDCNRCDEHTHLHTQVSRLLQSCCAETAQKTQNGACGQGQCLCACVLSNSIVGFLLEHLYNPFSLVDWNLHCVNSQVLFKKKKKKKSFNDKSTHFQIFITHRWCDITSTYSNNRKQVCKERGGVWFTLITM